MLMNQSYVEPTKFSQRTLCGTLWAGVAVSFGFLLFRFYVRLKIFRRFHIEDPFVLTAWLINLAYAILWQKTATDLYSVIAVESGQISTPPNESFSPVYTQLHSLLASYLLFYTALWSVKLSFLLFFRSLGNEIRRHMILWYCVLAYTIASYLVCVGTINYSCLAEAGGLVSCQSPYGVHYGPRELRLATVFDTTTDALIIVVSTNLLWNASIELRKKLALTGIFCLTIIIISVSIIRVVLTTRRSRLDVTWLLLWSGVEITVAIIVACIASFRILYTKSERFRRSSSSAHRLSRGVDFMNNGPSIPLNARVVHPALVIPSDNIHRKRPTSTDTFEEAILPMDNVYAPHEYIGFSRLRESYGVEPTLKSPLIQPYGKYYQHR